MSDLLVTGGAGFIGCNFVRTALQKGHSVSVMDKLTYAGSLRNLEDVKDRIKFFKGDISDKKDALRAARNAEVIVHFAAETHVDRSIQDAAPFITSNIAGTVNLLEAARKNDVRKFVHISTDEVYGSTRSGYFEETDRLDPKNPYSATKAAAEHMVTSFANTYGLKASITRSSNNYGPYQNPEKFIPKMITNALANKPLPVYGRGENIRDWIYVEDNCEGILTVVEKGKDGEAYNIGGGQEKRNIDVAKTVLNVLGKPESLIQFVPDRPGHDFRYALNIGKIKNLGWTPRYSFEEGVRKKAQWYIDNKWFWN